MRDDDKILGELKNIVDSQEISIECLASLIRGNHFQSANFLIDTFVKGEKVEQLDQAIQATKEASKHVQDAYNSMLDKIKE